MLLGHTHALLTQTCFALNYNMKRQVQPVLCAGTSPQGLVHLAEMPANHQERNP